MILTIYAIVAILTILTMIYIDGDLTVRDVPAYVFMGLFWPVFILFAGLITLIDGPYSIWWSSVRNKTIWKRKK